MLEDVPPQEPLANRIQVPLFQRVVIRYRIDDPRGEYKFTDIKGIIHQLDDTKLWLAPEGQEHLQAIDIADIEAAKPIPPRPPRRHR